MEAWNKFTQTVSQGAAQLTQNAAPVGERLTRNLGTLSQQAKERFGAVDAQDITELPQEYKDLEHRVDALRNAHQNIIRVTKVYETEGYDYPVQVQESFNEVTKSLGHTVTSWAATATKQAKVMGVSVQPTSAPAQTHKTLAHAFSRAAASGALELGAEPAGIVGVSSPISPNSAAAAGGAEGTRKTSVAAVGAQESRLGQALQKLALAQDQVGNARLKQDEEIITGFYHPWTSFGNQINLAMKARQAVREARLHLDSWKQTLKAAEVSGSSSKLDQYRAEVEGAEDKLVAATEEAIGLMKNVLENPEPIRILSELAKAQSDYHRAAAQILDSVQSDISRSAISMESDYRAGRA
ncbi:hypothetical protein K437DRAFT_258690 [Tilletiaria anomala UBC 951]|uniref:BAR domain-containing protein n=1 Tax=Tilletiaria anomala (strain ATCC 24038 / CBS 436.72 / UBC 951) TaxID=1037660 RepID=A0A066VP87_TILAU|nr:uncharacterized protein K437DRAFT_258690 [Tilletiaria anomala UBC 951]KDN40350.1 hypothetical protein K437DRAFT_258690 [Tilletiaria anomala UBC 951]